MNAPVSTNVNDTQHRNVLVAVWGLAIVSLIALVLTACTAPPKIPVATRTTVDYVQNVQDAGVVGIDAQHGALVRQPLVTRYNALIDQYGKNTQFTPALVHDEGVTAGPAGLFYMDLEHWQKFLLMNRWHRSGTAPQTSK